MLPFLAAFAPLIGGAISAVGKLLEPKPPPNVTTSTVDLAKLRADAEAAGFNPLTIIRNGGMGGFTTTRGPDMSWNPVGEALGTFGASFANWSYDPVRSGLENDLLRKQIKSFDLPSQVSTGGSILSSGGSWADQAKGGPRFAGFDVKKSPAWSDAQVNEDRYGDIVDSIGGIFILAADTWETVKPAVQPIFTPKKGRPAPGPKPTDKPFTLEWLVTENPSLPKVNSGRIRNYGGM